MRAGRAYVLFAHRHGAACVPECMTGILEIAGAIGLVLPRTSRLAAAWLIVLFAAMFPANVHAARQNLKIGGRPVTPLPLRAAVQAGLIAAAAATMFRNAGSTPRAGRVRATP